MDASGRFFLYHIIGFPSQLTVSSFAWRRCGCQPVGAVCLSGGQAVNRASIGIRERGKICESERVESESESERVRLKRADWSRLES